MIVPVGPFLPHDLLLATGADVRAVSFEDIMPREDSSDWFENRFSPWADALVEQWMDGKFDDAEAVIFSRGEDMVQRVYYYICELKRRNMLGGPEPLLFDVCLIDRASSELRQVNEVRLLAERFGLNDAALEDAIAATNRRRARHSPAPGLPICLLGGSLPADSTLHHAIEAAGCAPVGETLTKHWSDLGPAVKEGTGDPALAIACQIRARTGARSFADPAQLTAMRIADAKPFCGVLWLTEDDESAVWQVPAMRRPFEEQGIPLLVLTRRDPAMQDGAAEEIAKFVRSVTA